MRWNVTWSLTKLHLKEWWRTEVTPPTHLIRIGCTWPCTTCAWLVLRLCSSRGFSSLGMKTCQQRPHTCQSLRKFHGVNISNAFHEFRRFAHKRLLPPPNIAPTQHYGDTPVTIYKDLFGGAYIGRHARENLSEYQRLVYTTQECFLIGFSISWIPLDRLSSGIHLLAASGENILPPNPILSEHEINIWELLSSLCPQNCFILWYCSYKWIYCITLGSRNASKLIFGGGAYAAKLLRVFSPARVTHSASRVGELVGKHRSRLEPSSSSQLVKEKNYKL